MTAERVTGLERVLGSARGRAAAILVLAALVSLVATLPHVESADLRGRDADLVEIYLEQLVLWSAWGLLLWPLTLCAAALLRATRSWFVTVALLVPLSLATAYGFLHLDYHVKRPSQTEVEAWRAEGRRLQAERRAERLAEGFEWNAERGFRSRPRSWERNRSRWRAMRAGIQAPDLDSVHWRFRWIQNVLLFWALLGMGAGLSAFLRLRGKERVAAALELRATKLRGELAGAQLETLRGQLQPHFLFNALHSVGGLIRSGEERTALEALSAIGRLLRATLDLGGDAEIPLARELELLRRYLRIEELRLGDRLRARVDVEEGLEACSIPTLLLLPLVENAIQYGIAPRLEGGELLVSARRVEGALELCVQDDGPGFPAAILAPGAPGEGTRGIGLENSRSRLRALYGEAQSFEVSNPPEGGAAVRIRLPLRENETRDRDEVSGE